MDTLLGAVTAAMGDLLAPKDIKVCYSYLICHAIRADLMWVKSLLGTCMMRSKYRAAWESYQAAKKQLKASHAAKRHMVSRYLAITRRCGESE